MKLLINTSNIVVGGGIQVSLSFLEALKNHLNNEYHVFLSPAVGKQLNVNSFGDNFTFYNITVSPSQIKTGFKIRKLLSDLECKIKPDLVFTVFGPAYWRPKNLHVSGFADGWCYTPESIAFAQVSFKQRVRLKLLIFIKNFLIKKSDFIIVETETAKKNISRHLKIQQNKIFVVGNTYHQIFSNVVANITETVTNNFKLLVLSSFYKHKNLSVINAVSTILKAQSEVNFEFYLTLPDNVFKAHFADDCIINLGPQGIDECPSLYQNAHVLFLPTLLETFTANYPEAMKMQTPILTSDLDFARELCGEAALYFNPLSASDIATKIMKLQNNQALQLKLIEAGNIRLKEYETAGSRTKKYLNIFETLLNFNKTK